jgi:hypothetical protein
MADPVEKAPAPSDWPAALPSPCFRPWWWSWLFSFLPPFRVPAQVDALDASISLGKSGMGERRICYLGGTSLVIVCDAPKCETQLHLSASLLLPALLCPLTLTLPNNAQTFEAIYGTVTNMYVLVLPCASKTSVSDQVTRSRPFIFRRCQQQPHATVRIHDK